MKTRSAKNKGLRLQNYVAELLRERYGLETSEVKPAIMGESGVDIKLSQKAREVFPFDIECKNVERLDIWGALLQAEMNSSEGIPLLVFKRNRSKVYCVLELDKLLEVKNE